MVFLWQTLNNSILLIFTVDIELFSCFTLYYISCLLNDLEKLTELNIDEKIITIELTAEIKLFKD